MDSGCKDSTVSAKAIKEYRLVLLVYNGGYTRRPLATHANEIRGQLRALLTYQSQQGSVYN